MKNYLSSVPYLVQQTQLYNIRLLLFTFFIIFCSSQVSAANIDSVNSQKFPQNTIYVSSGTTFYGSQHLLNVNVVIIQNGIISEKKIKTAKKYFSQSKHTTYQKNSEKNVLKILQDKINKKIKHCFYAPSHDSDLLRSSKLRFAIAAVGPDLSFKFNKASVNIEYGLQTVSGQDAKKKFYSSLSYLEFGKLRNSFLRGPPNYFKI